MRPLSLTMSAFGPYAGTEVIPMEKLGTKGLYLITGDTGSGKTTIFDGISFALYGEASGDNRDGSMLRSKYAEPETPTNVELVFELRGRKYTVKRNPEYMRPKTRGEGFTSEKASAELCCDDGRIVTGNTRVTEAVTELLGLDRRQFSQIAMIAQGDFLKLLLAPTEERKKIFRKLFHTEKYAWLQERLKREVSECRSELGILEDRIKGSRDSISWKETADDIPERELPGMLGELLEEEERRLKELTARREKQEKNLIHVRERLKIVEIKLDRKAQLDKLRRDMLTAEEELKQLRRDEEKARSACENSDKMREEISLIRGQKDSYSELDDRKTHLSEISSRKGNLESRLEEISREAGELETRRNTCLEEMKILEESTGRKSGLEKEEEQLISREEELENLRVMSVEWQQSQEAYRNAQTDYKNKADIEDAAAAEYNRSYRMFLDEQAGIIAENLEEGKPCPVCGSTHHPEPAGKKSEAPSEADVEKLREDYSVAAKAATDAHGRAAAARASMDDKTEKLTLRTAELLGETPVDKVGETCADMKADLQEKKSEIALLLEKIALEEIRYGKLKEKLPELDDKLAGLREEAIEKDKQKAALTGEITLLSGEVESLSQKLAFDSLKDAETRITALEKTLSDRASELESLTRETVEKEKKLAQLKGKADSMEEDAEGEVEETTEDLKEVITGLEKEKTETDEAVTALSGRLALDRQNGDRLLESLGEAEKLRERLSLIKALSDAANGNVTGREKVMLETYVQGAYFDRIIRRANLRLMEMTGGQYELRRSAGGKDLRSITGLELDVADHYNGSTRSVRTLSGGESFKASLSLALGLADEIQSSAGGIRLDTMFIDEGFGSLDGESLSQAIGALANLGEGDRLVGIISHVDELKNRINRQLVVTKGKSDGSHVSVILD